MVSERRAGVPGVDLEIAVVFVLETAAGKQLDSRGGIGAQGEADQRRAPVEGRIFIVEIEAGGRGPGSEGHIDIEPAPTEPLAWKLTVLLSEPVWYVPLAVALGAVGVVHAVAVVEGVGHAAAAGDDAEPVGDVADHSLAHEAVIAEGELWARRRCRPKTQGPYQTPLGLVSAKAGVVSSNIRGTG